MKRNWDVIREVLLEVEALDAETRNGFSYAEGQGDEARVAHALMLWNAGFLEGHDVGGLDGENLLEPDLTWAGRELLDTLRSKPVWEKIKAKATETGIELTFDAVKKLGAWALGQVLGI